MYLENKGEANTFMGAIKWNLLCSWPKLCISKWFMISILQDSSKS